MTKETNNNNNDTENLTTLETTYKSYSDYFIDYDISKTTITEDDYTGKGTKSEPFVIRSTRGFLYLTNSAESGINLGGKYLELECDIISNDEVFDENGEIVKGDGVVYSFETFLIGTSVESIDGNNHSIIGAYQNRPTASWVQLFYNVKKVVDLKFENVCFIGYSFVSAFGYVEYAYNLKILSGTFITFKDANCASIAYNVTKMINCENYASVKGIYYVAGLAVDTKGTNIVIKDCVNYGNVTSSGHYVCGILGYVKNLTIENCTNYGNIKSTNGVFLGGISWDYFADNDVSTYVNCVNYGTLEAGHTIGGIVASGNKLDFVGCANYGRIICRDKTAGNRNCGELVGNVTYSDTYDTKVNIIDCRVCSISGEAIIGSVSESKTGKTETNVNITNLRYVLESHEVDSFNSVIYTINQRGTPDIYLSNIEIINTTDESICLFYAPLDFNVTIRNLCYQAKEKQDFSSFICLPYYNDKNNFKVDSIIAYSTKDKAGCYFGSNFDSFFVDYKTGNIWYKAFSGRGTFQGKVTEELMQKRGYEKKTI